MVSTILKESFVYSFSESPFYVVCVDFNAEGTLVASSGSDHGLKLFDSYSEKHIWTCANAHKNVVSKISFEKNVNANHFLFYSSGLDGYVRLWDVRQKGNRSFLEWKVNGEVHCYDSNTNCNMLAVGINHKIALFDLRNPNVNVNTTTTITKPYGILSQIHSDEVTQIKFFPQGEGEKTLYTTGMDGLLCSTRIDSGDEGLEMVINLEDIVSNFEFYGDRNSHLACSSHSHKCYFVSLEKSECVGLFDSLGKQYDYLLSPLTDSTTGNVFVTGGSYDGNCTLFSFPSLNRHPHNHQNNNFSGKPFMSLTGGHNTVIRDIAWNNLKNCLCTGGEDSRICIWNWSQNQRNMNMKSDLNNNYNSFGPEKSTKIRKHYNPY